MLCYNAGMCRKYAHEFLSSLLAGLFITIGATVFLVMKSAGDGYLFTILGSLFFALGLFGIIHWRLWLYTGKVGFALDNPPGYFTDLLVCLAGNLVGMVACSKMLLCTRLAPALVKAAAPLVATKTGDGALSIFLLSVMCGVMIYIAVKGHAVCDYACGKVMIVFLAISVFILCGFEHVVANAAYFTFAGVFNGQTVWLFAIMAVGNGVGSIALDGLLKLTDRLKV